MSLCPVACLPSTTTQEHAKQTTKTRTVRRAKPNPVTHLSGPDSIRRGFLACRASVEELVATPGVICDAALLRHTQKLVDKVRTGLQEAAQLAISHPTADTLGDAFNAADAVQAACRTVRRRVTKVGDAGMQARVELFLIGVKAGITQLESGLERIPLLPTSAPDYPEEEQE